MKILVTGGAGFIGSNFIIYWLKKNPQDYLINLDKLTYAGNLTNLKEIEGHPNYKFVKGDICDRILVDKIMEEADAVCHFAAESHVDRSILEPSAFIQTNINGTHVLLEAAVKHKIKRFHHISTDEVFGSLKEDTRDKFNEQSPYNPTSPYAASKAASDHLVRAYHHTYGLPVTITNCSNNFGPFQFPEKLIPLVITNLLEGKKVPVYSRGSNIRDWLYVTDHIKAVERVLKEGKIGETYCIGGMTSDITNLEVVKIILKILGKNEDMIEFVKDRPGHDFKYAIDWSKIKKELDWQPENDFEKLLFATVNWFKENENWWQRIKTGEYLDYYKKQYISR